MQLTWKKILKIKWNRKSGFTVIFINPTNNLGLKVNWDKAYNSVPIKK
jgi:hypothetical protein